MELINETENVNIIELKPKFNKKEYFKNYWIENKDKLMQKYYDNHEEILKKKNAYQAKRKEARHEYYIKNKEKIMNQSKMRYQKLKKMAEQNKEIEGEQQNKI